MALVPFRIRGMVYLFSRVLNYIYIYICTVLSPGDNYGINSSKTITYFTQSVLYLFHMHFARTLANMHTHMHTEKKSITSIN